MEVIIVLGVAAGLLEGIGLSSRVPIIDAIQSSMYPLGKGGAVEMFARTYTAMGVPFTLDIIVVGPVVVVGAKYAFDFGASDETSGDFRSVVDSSVNATVRLRRNETAANNVYQFASAISIFVLIYLAVTFTSKSLGMLGVFLFAIFRLAPISSMLNHRGYPSEGNLSNGKSVVSVLNRMYFPEKAKLTADHGQLSGDVVTSVPIREGTAISAFTSTRSSKCGWSADTTPTSKSSRSRPWTRPTRTCNPTTRVNVPGRRSGTSAICRREAVGLPISERRTLPEPTVSQKPLVPAELDGRYV
ncbi:ABC transporter ATP-binding protein [Halorussus sp. MSC15.2]|uniref:ABC transporter ATP-binding protein n=1 Tax=Halorussus sp. MSC15.2 TaxID=2283638 RepID=UPI0013D27EDF|nr:ABC transporter ATP-binding protein [Halorussus sp. MSC15.2]NEU58091.1 ABC transporter ATP-binding protein [Halorussus sp. MSC15.2]